MIRTRTNVGSHPSSVPFGDLEAVLLFQKFPPLNQA